MTERTKFCSNCAAFYERTIQILSTLTFEGECRYSHADWQPRNKSDWCLDHVPLGHVKPPLPLKDCSLREAIDELRAVPSRLSEISDPWGDLMEERRGERDI